MDIDTWLIYLLAAIGLSLSPGPNGLLALTHGALHGRRKAQAPDAAMGIVGLAGYEDAPVRTLSAGQRKRLALPRLWLSPAALWLLDEPYANLDLDGINLVNRMISAHLRDGGAALVTTHGAYAAPPVQTRMLVLERGGTA